ncbi:hypothetical protein J1N35_046050, partial [Gossypium stocksii]
SHWSLEEHSLLLSQHSSPSQSNQEQALIQKPTSPMVSHGLNLFKPLHHIPSNFQLNSVLNNRKGIKYIVHNTSQELQFIRELQNLQKPEQYQYFVQAGRTRLQHLVVEHKHMVVGPIHNLLGADVRGKVDGAFDSGFLMTIIINRKLLREVLFSSRQGWISRELILATTPTSTCHVIATQHF